MNKECENTKKALPRYLRGHVFRITRGKIERHLDRCVICRSEFEALRRTEETLLILRDINAAGGVVGRVRDGVSALGKLRTLLYHPLWIAAIALAVSAVVYYLVTPRQLELEIDSIVKSEPATTTAVPLAVPASPAGVSGPTETERPLPTKAATAGPKARPRRQSPPASPGTQHTPKKPDEKVRSASPEPPASPGTQHPPKKPDEKVPSASLVPPASPGTQHPPKKPDETVPSASPVPPASPDMQHPPKTPDETSPAASPAPQPSQ